MKFKRYKYKNNDIKSKDYQISNFIPYLSHFNRDTLITKDGKFMSTIKIEGFSFETADDADLDIKKNFRNNLFKGISSSDYSIHVHTIRKKKNVYPKGDFNFFFASKLNEVWKNKNMNNSSFINEHYITLIRNGANSVDKIKGNLMNFFNDEEDSKFTDIVDHYNDFLEMRDRLFNGFMEYKPRLLSIKKKKHGTISEILSFLSYIVHLGYEQDVLISKLRIDNYLVNKRLSFNDKTIECSSHDYHKYAGIVSLKEYRPATHAGILDGFMSMPFDLIISQHFSFKDRAIAISKMQLQQRRLAQSEDVAISQIQEINSALDSAMGGAFGFGDHYLSVMCLHDNLKGLDNALSQTVVEFSNSGITAVREKMNMEAAFWSQLPANDSFSVRKSTINTLNLSSFASFHNYPTGKFEDNHWGNSVTLLKTTSGTPYFFNFHARDVGHTMIIGPTGAGKTVLMNFLSAQALKFSPRMFFFDKDRGSEVFLKSLSAKYTCLNASKKSGFNPLKLEDTNENRLFLLEWLTLLTKDPSKAHTAEDLDLIEAAINGNYRLKKEERKLSNIAPFLGVPFPSSVAGRLKNWYGKGSRAGAFDNDDDIISFKDNAIYGFEMGELLQDPVALAPMLLYLFHRINMSLDGEPTMVVLDEAWALIDNPVFGPKLKDWLKVMRKLNAFVVFATQSVEDAAKSAISDTLVQQTATQIFLPNLKATDAYKNVFMLTNREYSIVKNTNPSSRFFLIKQDNDAVVARIDLRGMDDEINILSGRASTIKILDKAIEQYGEDPSQWIPQYLKSVKEEDDK